MTALLRDRYEPLEEVGRGAEGRVVRAWDHLHGRPVAVKMRLGAGDRAIALAEARMLLGLTPHRLLPLVREDFFAGDDYCLVMDWVEGRNLAQVLTARGGPGLPLDEVLGYLEQVAEALDHLHGHDPPVVHGDVKPANVVVTDRGRVVLVDFGVSRSGASTLTGYGTPGYSAPEVASGAPPSPAVDVFGLAATAFALLTGAPPGPGSRPRWRQLMGDRAHQVELALRRGLAYDPARRPTSATELVAALRGEARVRTNLPVAISSFIGRGAEVTALRARMDAARLVTLTGPGGVGKTRLATEAAAEVLGEHPDGVYLVELAPVSDPALVPNQIAAVLGVTEHAGQRVEGMLAEHLSARRALLVVDNCEHLVEEVAGLINRLLRASSHLRVLATSREPLGIVGEDVFRVPPLGLPPAGVEDPDALASSEAVRLFVSRASASRNGFTLDATTAPAVAAICRRLDGIPLAIELAASRTASLSTRELASRLDDRFRVLRGGSRTSHPRHRTLRAVVDWSHDTLPDAEQTLFRRLSVFAGSFTLTAAEGVTGGDEVDGHDVVDLLGSLVDRSLVVAQDDGRYRLLETLRAYGLERLAESGEEEPVRQRHLDWFAAVASSNSPPYRGDAVAFLDTLEAEHDELRAALRWALDSGRVEAAADLAFTLYRFWGVRGYFRQGRQWFEELLDGGVSGIQRARALRLMTRFPTREVDVGDDVAGLEESLTLSRQAGDREESLACLCTLALAAIEQGDLEGSRRRLAEAWDEYRRWGAPDAVLYSLLTVKARLAGRVGDTARALALRHEALAVARRVGAELMVLDAVGRLAQDTEGSGDVGRAKALYQETSERASRLRDSTWQVTATGALGRLAQFAGDLGQAAALYANALREVERTGHRGEAWFWLFHVASLAVEAGQFGTAARVLGMESALARGRRHVWVFKDRHDQAVDRTRGALGPAAFESAREAGAALAVDEALAEVMAWLRAFASEAAPRNAATG